MNGSATVGVLLPVRIETRFLPGRLRIRVVPDEPWFARHDPTVPQGEVDALVRFIDATAMASTDADRRQAWREFVGQVGGARAVYLIRLLVVTGPDGQPAVRPLESGEQRTEPRFPRIEGFPATLHVWLVRAGEATEVLTLAVDSGRLLADFPDPDVPGDRRWWESWDEAVKAGLAGDTALDGDPNDIEALYVTGLGDGKPAEVFASHRDEGRLGLLAPGTPTNSVDGAPAGPLGQDPDTWWDVLHTPASDNDRSVSAALTGDPELLGNLPGPSEPQPRWNAAMVAGLWPALWGFAGEDVWGIPNGTLAAAEWAPGAVAPEGPFPTVRVGSQPYGLFPVTALRRWSPAAGDPTVEAGLLKPLLELRDAYSTSAEAFGTVVGASTDRLLDLVGRVPTSPLFRHRRAWPLEIWWLVLLLLGSGMRWEEIDRAWLEQYATARRLGLAPLRRYGASAAARRVDLPLVVPEELPSDRTIADVLKQLVELALQTPTAFASTERLEREFLRFPPNSLLLRLAIRSLQVAIGDVGRARLKQSPPTLDPIVRQSKTPALLETWIEATSADVVRGTTPEASRFQRVAEALASLSELDPARTERLLSATVDTAGFRIDPWLVGLPTRRLRDLLDAQSPTFRLGAYGWVDAPRPGTPGPTAAGLLHAPSPNQAITATVLRDRAVNDPTAARWDLDLTSRSVRDADTIAEHVRVGAHLAEAVGREVERVVADPAIVSQLRRDYPVRTEHVGRRVCDGLAVLAALAAQPATLGLDADRLAGLDRLRVALDSYGDLLVAEAVSDVVQGRAETAGAVLDAAAGLSRPPHLDLLHTSRQGRAALTGVVVVLPDAAEPTLPADASSRAEVSPAALADASVAAFVQRQAGEAADWTFEVASIEASPAPGATTTVSLADVGLLPADALSLSLTDLERLAVDAGAAALGVDPATLELAGGTGPERYESSARLVALLGRRPAGPDLVTEQADTVVDTTAVLADLLTRYTLARDVAVALVTRLSDELSNTTPDGGLGTADPALLGRLVRAARGWGVAPDPPPDPTAGDTPASAERRLVAVAARALELLQPRLAAAPSTDRPSPTEPSPAAALSRDDLVAALAALVSPTGQLAVTARMPRSALPTLQPDAALDADWLPVLAAVRHSVALLEVHQLAAGNHVGYGTALAGWTNKPGDPWQRNAADPRRLVAAYADPAIDLNAISGVDRLAVAAVDRFAEVIPEEEQTTGAAFGFDAPAARAPQAVLLAVPPDLEQPWDEMTLLEVVVETRQLAHARMARPADLDDDVRGLLPGALLPAAGAIAVPLDRAKV